VEWYKESIRGVEEIVEDVGKTIENFLVVNY
jgi:hypothetical protein